MLAGRASGHTLGHSRSVCGAQHPSSPLAGRADTHHSQIIIENFQEIKDELIAKDRFFSSDRNTEFSLISSARIPRALALECALKLKEIS